MTAIYVEITATRGSAPRDAGTAMKVTADNIEGTIGGGALEHKAIAHARHLLAKGQREDSQTIPLGPGLGQCCGGAVSLHYTATPRPLDNSAPLPIDTELKSNVPLWLWGAGHVGRAVVAACPPAAFDVTWIDSAPDRFPTDVPEHVTVTPAAEMPRLAAHAPQDAHHLIFTYSHDIDLALCAALLRRGAASIGLIGSDTKKARFSRRLSNMGLDPSGIICPIGEKSLGKLPAQIAHGTLTALIARTQTKVSA
ncbi:xanthine dehydrogenase accessory protein XdhC [Sulfitobacter sp. S0837]|uniref:xanthine dehydrogenase accessory protein XdhC n=1 Tax=Sulfitobacter maritimus TaxID=2741719 RepID=UPI0015820D86|nr:xanthine dehydrogenase accessory protein XdhC [Sulfitobacter maritimus]NUH66523.1 xanthine dehydrogenase accessory protein XdhC [Sulfitobacter maritimus]